MSRSARVLALWSVFLMQTRSIATLSILLWACPLAVEARAGQWDGIYLGLNAGGALSNFDFSTGPDDSSWFKTMGQTSWMWAHGNQDGSAFDPLVGVSLDYSHQIESFVFGAELGLNALDSEILRSNTYQYSGVAHNFTYMQHADIHGLYTLKGHAGYAWGKSLVSANAGIAAATVDSGLDFYDDYPIATKYMANHTSTDFEVGWTVGVSYQYMLSDDITLKFAYAYADLGKTDFAMPVHTSSGSKTGVMNFSSDTNLSTFSIGIAKKF